jgi:aerobic-type carbon monoxide dehydrogenase small subunit (CoxS/CutS family)
MGADDNVGRVPPSLGLTVDGRALEVPDDGATLLAVLREHLGLSGPKDGCSPQGQCGCCTVLVDGAPRVACVTPARRVAGRAITTIDGLPEAEAWADALVATGGSQCGFCTPGIICRLAAGGDLAAHLCRCTGWQTIREAASRVGAPSSPRDLDAAARRATIEGGVPQSVGREVALGRGGFADDMAPADALVAVPDGAGGWAVGETLAEARQHAGKVQGRRTTAPPRHPLDVPAGEWARTLRTTWVEPAYLETDASWCVPGGDPASPLGNGGAFGGKVASIAPAAAKQLADELGRPVRVLLSREDTVRLGPKRPPLAAGVRDDGTGEVVVARTPGVAAAILSVAPGLTVTEIDVAGPPTSAALRAAGWAEAAVLLGSPTVTAPNGATATATITGDGVHVRVACGDPLDEVVLRSYCIGAVHMALGWVRSEGLMVDDDGVVHDLTIRSFGIVRPNDMPPVEVAIDGDGPPINGSDAVFAAVAAAEWIRQGFPPDWPTGGT